MITFLNARGSKIISFEVLLDLLECLQYFSFCLFFYFKNKYSIYNILRLMIIYICIFFLLDAALKFLAFKHFWDSYHSSSPENCKVKFTLIYHLVWFFCTTCKSIFAALLLNRWDACALSLLFIMLLLVYNAINIAPLFVLPPAYLKSLLNNWKCLI